MLYVEMYSLSQDGIVASDGENFEMISSSLKKHNVILLFTGILGGLLHPKLHQLKFSLRRFFTDSTRVNHH